MPILAAKKVSTEIVSKTISRHVGRSEQPAYLGKSGQNPWIAGESEHVQFTLLPAQASSDEKC
jgi:hypothetical protein